MSVLQIGAERSIRGEVSKALLGGVDIFRLDYHAIFVGRRESIGTCILGQAAQFSLIYCAATSYHPMNTLCSCWVGERTEKVNKIFYYNIKRSPDVNLSTICSSSL